MQRVNYPSETLREKNGTCLELSQASVSIAEAGGLNAGMVLVNGHAYAYVDIPRKDSLTGTPIQPERVFVETTGCGNGMMAESLPFNQAVAIAQ